MHKGVVVSAVRTEISLFLAGACCVALPLCRLMAGHNAASTVLAWTRAFLLARPIKR